MFIQNNSDELTIDDIGQWELPEFQVYEFKPKATKYCFVAVSGNEGARIKNQLKRMKKNSRLAEIILNNTLSR